jgi:putative heme-binding domain-containing protein
MPRCLLLILLAPVLWSAPSLAAAQALDEQLLAEPPAQLLHDVRTLGDARRGAILFHQPALGCVKCHSVGDDAADNPSLGPNLAKLKELPQTADAQLLESMLKPSATIREGYETLQVVLADGRVVVGLKADARGEKGAAVRDPASRQVLRFTPDEVEAITTGKQSLMPQGVVNALRERSQFLDLARYVLELREGGVALAKELQPPPELIGLQLPAYEAHVDHAGLLRKLDGEAVARGAKIYGRVCQNCHGTLESPGSLPTALRFGEGKFRNGYDPFAMYQTVTHGFGLMTPQSWMVPKQKYDVIHYIRETFLKSHNPSQYAPVTEAYLASLPPGDTPGPEPVDLAPWSDMNYGPWMFNTIEVSRDGSNIAYKGLAVRLDPGPGGVSRGKQWMLFDHDTMRIAGGWTHAPGAASRFIDWQGIHFDGRHQAHPHVVGDILFANPTGPGWANPLTGSFADEARVVGRDGKRYGPLPKEWATYLGLHQAGTEPIVAYRIGDMLVLEKLSATPISAASVEGSKPPSPTVPLFLRTLHLAPTTQQQTLLVATAAQNDAALTPLGEQAAYFGRVADVSQQPGAKDSAKTDRPEAQGEFQGQGGLQIAAPQFDLVEHDFTITARIKTKQDGVIFAYAQPGDKWTPNGQVLFLRGGRLSFDIGWVGVIQAPRKINDNKWHDVAVVWTQNSGEATLFVDGLEVARGKLAAKAKLEKAVARIGFGAPNFPEPSALEGSLRDVRFLQRALNAAELRKLPAQDEALRGHWLRGKNAADIGPKAVVVIDPGSSRPGDSPAGLVAGFAGDAQGCKFQVQGERLCLQIPPSQQARTLLVWMTKPLSQVNNDKSSISLDAATLASIEQRTANLLREPSLAAVIGKPATPLWPEVLTTTAKKGEVSSSGFAIDELTTPEPNPWLARLRLGGLDFDPDGNRMVVCTWDGDVYRVEGLSQLNSADPAPKLTWRRIASGLFQPLGILIVKHDIYVTCRDQLVILRDHNGDGATDEYVCFNNDQQVTEHFHEFAMGLQRDEQGNFYYAKSARHALPALVPHHGTLLKVSPDGAQTTILAVGFRAANGVCLNPDGTFIVTDQEGHWNPKNRINWVTPGGFYGNMYGYHDVTDESDEAMSPPLCWITNAFDRSPAELLWVPKNCWGNLQGTLLNLSYGYGKVFTVPHEHLAKVGQVQGGMCELPIGEFPTGIMRGRFHPQDGQLYVCGLFAWASSRSEKEGGLYRIRYTGEGATVPVGAHAAEEQLSMTFSDPLDAASVADLSRYAFKVWGLKRTKNYGSPHVDEHAVAITSARLSPDGRTLTLTIPKLAPTWCYELRCQLKTTTGQPAERVIHGTIHALAKEQVAE